MTADPDTVAPDTDVREAARLIHESGHNRLPVVEDGRLVGVVTRLDVLAPSRREPAASGRSRTVDLGAIERNCARLPERAVRASSRPTRYGHGAVGRARRSPAAPPGSAVATAAEARALRRRGVEAPILVMGALTAAELRAALDARTPTSSPGPSELGARRRRACTSSSTPAWAGSAPRTASWRCALAARPERSVGLMTHFATADEPRRRPLRGAARAPSASSSTSVGRDDLLVHAANSAAALRDPASHFDMVRCGIAIYGMDPFGDDPAAHGLEPALSLRSWVAAVRRFERGRQRRLRPPLDGRRADLGRDACRSATATAGGARSPTTATC